MINTKEMTNKCDVWNSFMIKINKVNNIIGILNLASHVPIVTLQATFTL